jgi:RNA polymerase sigma-70 factor, ECF subfamily
MGSTDAQSGRERSAPPARAVAGVHDVGARGSPAKLDFAREYENAYRVLWVVAAGVLGRSGGAEDVVQEAALLALRKVGEFEPGTHFVAWMAQMVRFVALNHLRKRSRNATVPLDETGVGARILPGETGLSDRELQLTDRGELPAGQTSFDDELMHGLESLTDVARACLLLRTLEGLDYEQIGRVLGIPQGTAMSHVHRSRMKLREQLMPDSGKEQRRP